MSKVKIQSALLLILLGALLGYSNLFKQENDYHILYILGQIFQVVGFLYFNKGTQQNYQSAITKMLIGNFVGIFASLASLTALLSFPWIGFIIFIINSSFQFWGLLLFRRQSIIQHNKLSGTYILQAQIIWRATNSFFIGFTLSFFHSLSTESILALINNLGIAFRGISVILIIWGWLSITLAFRDKK